jgi:hypothetical protein
MLHNLAASVPRGAILLIEDIDCAFPSRDADSDDDEDDLPVPTLPPDLWVALFNPPEWPSGDR